MSWLFANCCCCKKLKDMNWLYQGIDKEKVHVAAANETVRLLVVPLVSLLESYRGGNCWVIIIDHLSNGEKLTL